MICQACNAEIGSDVRFCPKCGVPVISAQPRTAQGNAAQFGSGYTPALVPRMRVTRNLQTLGILWCVFGAYRVLAGLIGIFFLKSVAHRALGGGWPFDGSMPAHVPQEWFSFVLPFVAIATVLSAALAFVTGFSLLKRQPWARTLAIVAAVLALLKFPLGTGLGIYTLWVLAPGESRFEYEAISARPSARPYTV